MKKLIPVLFIATLFLWACNDDPNDEKITVSCIEFSPNAFMEGNEIIGTDVDVSTLALDAAGAEYEYNLVDSWNEAYNSTLNGTNSALLTVGYSEERKDLFKWAGPVNKGTYLIMSKLETGIGSAIGLDASKAIESIAVVSGWLETTILEDLGFTNLEYFDTFDEAVEAFTSDEVLAIAADGAHFASKVDVEYLAQAYDACFRYRTVYYYIAFSKDVDDVIVDACQTKIDEMLENGKTMEIFNSYFPNATTVAIPHPIQLFTEVAPPFNYYSGPVNDYTIEGSTMDFVREIQSRNAGSCEVDLTNWVDAYEVVQYQPNSALFTTARTPEREDMFQWVGPVSTLKACFYTLSESGIQITSLEDAKALSSIATPSNWYMHSFMIENDFQNIVATSFSPLVCFNQLLEGEVDAIFMYDLGINWLCETTSTPLTQISQQYEASYNEGYIAFSKATPSAIVNQWQSRLDEMREDGTYETIWNNWYEGYEMPGE